MSETCGVPLRTSQKSETTTKVFAWRERSNSDSEYNVHKTHSRRDDALVNGPTVLVLALRHKQGNAERAITHQNNLFDDVERGIARFLSTTMKPEYLVSDSMIPLLLTLWC